MQIDKTAYWIQIGANVAILIGLLLVGHQIRQNTEILRTEMLYQASWRATQGEEIMLGENPAAAWAKSISNPQDLTVEEHRIMEAYLWNSLETMRFHFQLAEDGLIDSWRPFVNETVPYLYGNPYAQAWWNVQKGSAYTVPEQLVIAIDAALEGNTSYTSEYHTQRMRALESADSRKE